MNTVNSGSKKCKESLDCLRVIHVFKKSAMRNYQHLSDFPENV